MATLCNDRLEDAPASNDHTHNGRGDNLPVSRVVPRVGVRAIASGDANQGRELQVLMGEFSQFDAPFSPLELVALGDGLS